jgi:hypothetical protein
MWCWSGNECGSLWGWWWLIPLVCMILCVLSCRSARRRPDGARFCGWGGVRRTDVEAMKNEIRELKEELGKMKGKQEE